MNRGLSRNNRLRPLLVRRFWNNRPIRFWGIMNRLPLLLLITLAGCCTLRSAPPVVAPSSQPAATQESTNTINRISIGSLNGWNLDVKVDGSGMVGYGDGDYDQFPAGTLDFKEILRVLRQQPVAPGY